MERPRHTPEQAGFAEFNPELWKRQQVVADDVERVRHEGIESGYLNMATAAGKTHVAAEDVGRFLAEKPDARVLYLCHQSDILRQARETFTEALGTDSHGYLFGGKTEDQEQVVYATFQTMTAELGEGKTYQAYDPSEFDYIVVDESHHGPAPTYREVIDYFRPEFMLGLTATPDRSDRQQLSELFGPELHKLSLEEAIVRGYVSDVDYRVLTDYVRRPEDLQEELESVPLSAIDREIFVPKDDAEIIAEIERHRREIPDARTLVFCQNIAHAEHFASLIPGAETIHSDLHDKVQESRLDRFRSGEIPVVAVVNKLNEGVDIPEANLVVFLRSTESQTVFLQQLGRGLRKVPGKGQVRILDFVASWERIAMVRRLFEGTKRRAHRRFTRPTSVGGSFNFDFSTEAGQVESLVKRIRERKSSKLKQPVPSQRQIQLERVKETLGVDKLPNQIVTEAEEKEYYRRIIRGDLAAKEEYMLRRLRMIYGIASGFPEAHGLTIADHFQNGVEGMERGMNAYKPDKHNYRMSLHVTNYARNRIARSIKSARLVRIPVNVEDKIEKIKKDRRKLGVKLQREPTAEELAEITGIDPEEINGLLRDDRNLGHFLPEEEAAEVADAESSTFEEVNQALQGQYLREALAELTYRERRVLELRYGLGEEHRMTLDEAGRAFSLTRERIRGIQNAALKKLQLLSVGQKLRDYQPESGPLPSAYPHTRPEPETPQRIEFEEAVGGVTPEATPEERRHAYEAAITREIERMRDNRTGLHPSRKEIHRVLQQLLPFGNRLGEEEVARLLRRTLKYPETKGRGSERFVPQAAGGSMNRGLVPDWERE